MICIVEDNDSHNMPIKNTDAFKNLDNPSKMMNIKSFYHTTKSWNTFKLIRTLTSFGNSRTSYHINPILPPKDNTK